MGRRDPTGRRERWCAGSKQGRDAEFGRFDAVDESKDDRWTYADFLCTRNLRRRLLWSFDIDGTDELASKR